MDASHLQSLPIAVIAAAADALGEGLRQRGYPAEVFDTDHPIDPGTASAVVADPGTIPVALAAARARDAGVPLVSYGTFMQGADAYVRAEAFDDLSRALDLVAGESRIGRKQPPWRLTFLGCAGPVEIGRAFSLPLDDEIVIGSRTGCEILVRAPNVVGRHAKVKRTALGVSVVDLSEVGATWIRGEPIREAPLASGDQVVIAAEFFFRLDGG